MKLANFYEAQFLAHGTCFTKDIFFKKNENNLTSSVWVEIN